MENLVGVLIFKHEWEQPEKVDFHRIKMFCPAVVGRWAVNGENRGINETMNPRHRRSIYIKCGSRHRTAIVMANKCNLISNTKLFTYIYGQIGGGTGAL